MDFTPGSMISAQPEDNRSTRANAMGSGTRAFQMALFIIFESGLQMLADNPVYYYRELPCTEFITSVPVTWDETKVLYAKVGEAVVVAKRKGEQCSSEVSPAINHKTSRSTSDSFRQDNHSH